MVIDEKITITGRREAKLVFSLANPDTDLCNPYTVSNLKSNGTQLWLADFAHENHARRFINTFTVGE